MDWRECLTRKIAKGIQADIGMILSLRRTAAVKIKSADALPKDLFVGKITLLYDALRGYLECIALEKGYKIYNHECYTAFLKEIAECEREADAFDKLRRIRNSINYYGRDVSEEEAEHVIAELKALIEKFKDNHGQ